MFCIGTKNNEGEVDMCMFVTVSHVAQDGLEIVIILLYLPSVEIIRRSNNALNQYVFLNSWFMILCLII